MYLDVLQGKILPSYPEYKGDPTNIIYRSLWSESLWCIVIKMKVYRVGKQEIAIPYRSPIDNRVHRYFPDFYMKVKERGGSKTICN